MMKFTDLLNEYLDARADFAEKRTTVGEDVDYFLANEIARVQRAEDALNDAFAALREGK